jgi:leucyl aminopeptidase
MKLKSLAILSLGVFGFSSPIFAKASFEFVTTASTDKKFHVIFIDDIDNLYGMS